MRSGGPKLQTTYLLQHKDRRKTGGPTPSHGIFMWGPFEALSGSNPNQMVGISHFWSLSEIILRIFLSYQDNYSWDFGGPRYLCLWFPSFTLSTSIKIKKKMMVSQNFTLLMKLRYLEYVFFFSFLFIVVTWKKSQKVFLWNCVGGDF